jgi:adenosylhomocysteine nucleosidase
MGRIGIMAALHDEIAVLLAAMGPQVRVERVGLRDYHVGELSGRECVVVLARIGKVAAAATAVTLIREFNAEALIFTGLAGAVAGEVRIGDVVVATSLVQHDLDACPLFPRHEVPLLGRSHFEADAALSERLRQSARDYLAADFFADVGPETRSAFGLDRPRVHTGVIASGDSFMNNGDGVQALLAILPATLCVEMEGAAVAQICHEYDVPFAVVRTISDRADACASVDFSAFLTQVARFCSAGILRRCLVAC